MAEGVVISRIEQAVRRVVAEWLGVGAEDLTPDVSLVDDLAADSLDLVEIALALEAECDVVLDDRLLDGVRTYRELVDAVLDARRSVPPAAPSEPVFARARLVPPGDGAAIEHAGALDPYTIEILADSARHAARGTRLEMELIEPVDASRRAAAWEWLAELADLGIEVSLHAGRVQRPPAA